MAALVGMLKLVEYRYLVRDVPLDAFVERVRAEVAATSIV